MTRFFADLLVPKKLTMMCFSGLLGSFQNSAQSTNSTMANGQSGNSNSISKVFVKNVGVLVSF